MRVGVDLQLARGTATGIGEYANGLFTALASAGVDAVALRSSRLDPWRFDRRLLWDQIGLPLAAARTRVDLVHCTAGTMPLACTAPIVVTVHDVAWLRVQAHARPYARAYFGPFALERYRHARRIIVDSYFSRDELMAVAPTLDPARIDVVYPGVSDDFARVVRARDDKRPYVLAVGTVERRKNLATLVRALVAIPSLRLVSAGPPTPYRAECLALAGELGVVGRVDIRGYVTRTELLALYAGATVAAVPSRYEGFGYGAAQALCAGVPLVAARAASLPEVVAADAELLDPDDVDAWVIALRAYAADPDRADARAALRRPDVVARFAWTTSARATKAAYLAAIGSSGRR